MHFHSQHPPVYVFLLLRTKEHTYILTTIDGVHSIFLAINKKTQFIDFKSHVTKGERTRHPLRNFFLPFRHMRNFKNLY